ncbi:MAG: hypothetical protein J0L78_11500 [Planctomycetes bacterium]|nr:hypothetical protein [Planctomycetota bacterium]
MPSSLSGNGLFRALRFAVAGLGIGAAALGLGCETYSKVQGKAGEIIANYKAGTLHATLNATPGAVLAASEQTLRDRGYSIEQNATTEEQGGLFARPPAYNLGRTIRIVVSPTTSDGSNLAITTNPWDESLARITLDGILERMGM